MKRMIEQYIVDLDKAFHQKDHQKIKQIIVDAENRLMSQQEYRFIATLYEKVRFYYIKQGEYEHLMHYSLRYLHYVEGMGMEQYNHAYYSIKSHVEHLLDNHTASIDYIEEAIKIALEEKDRRSLVSYLNYKAHVLCRMDRIEEANSALKDCFYWIRKLHLEKTQLHTESLIVCMRILLEMEGKQEQAVGVLHLIKSNSMLEDYPTSLMETLLLEGRLNEAIGEPERALDFYHQSLKVAEKNHLWYDVKRLYKYIADNLNNLKRFQESMTYLYRFIELSAELERLNKDALKEKIEIQIELEEAMMETGRLRQVNEKIRRQRDFDHLTGIYSRRYSHKYLQSLLENYHLHGEMFSVLTFDIDEFKVINDTYGHLVGDKAICEVVRTVQESLEGEYTFGRLGGDEFIVIFEKRDCEDVLPMVQRLIKDIRDTEFILGNERLSITISAGLIDSDHSINDIEAMLHLVDMYMYEAKNDGRSRVHTK